MNVRQIRVKPIVGFNGQEYEILYELKPTIPEVEDGHPETSV